MERASVLARSRRSWLLGRIPVAAVKGAVLQALLISRGCAAGACS
jgi:hypothetical protein